MERSTLGQHLIGAGMLVLALCAVQAGAADALPLEGCATGQAPRQDVWIGVFGEDPMAGVWSKAEDGCFRVHAPPGEQTTLVVVSKGTMPQVVPVSGRMVGARLDMRLSRGLALAGTVSGADGLPLPGAKVTIHDATDIEFELAPVVDNEWETGGAGAFLIEGLTPGRHRLEVTAPGHMPLTLDDVTVASEGVNRLELTLERAYSVTGRVVDREGAPLAGVEVKVRWRGISATTGRDGEFELGPFRAGANLTIFASSPTTGHGSDWQAVTVPRRPLELEIRPYLVRGRVLDADSGHPVESFRVVAHVGEAKSETTSVSDDAGVFAVAVDIATTWIVVEADGRSPWLEQLAIGAESETDLGDIVLEADRSIAGRVVDERTGAPIEGAWLSLRPEPGDALWVVAGLSPPAQANTDADGAFALHGNPAGRFRVQASAAGYASKYVQVPSGESWIDVELDAGAAIAGSLSLPDGTPANGSIFVFFRTGGHGWGEAITDGVFRLEGLSDGDYVLRASADAGPVEKRLVTIRDSQSVEDVRMTVRPGGEVSGSITGLAEGERVKFAVAERGGRPRPVRGRQIGTAAYGNGAFSLRGMPASATINASTSNGRMLRRDIVLDHHREAVIDLDFSGRSRIAGVVTAGDRPAAGVEIAALPADRFQPSARARTDNEGRYALRGLVDGPHVVLVYTGQSFDVVVGGDATLDIALPANSFSGSVALRRENVRALVRIALSPAQSEHPRFKLQRRIRGGGAFHFDGLPPGEYTVDVSAEGYERVSHRIHISGDEEMRFVLEADTDELVQPRSGIY